MEPCVDSVLEDAFCLSPKERAVLAEKLLDSLDEHQRAEIDQAWLEEVDRRMDSLVRGTSRLIPAEEVFEKYRKEQEDVGQ